MKGKGLSQQIKIKGKKKKKPFQERNASLIQAHEQLKFDFFLPSFLLSNPDESPPHAYSA